MAKALRIIRALWLMVWIAALFTRVGWEEFVNKNGAVIYLALYVWELDTRIETMED